ncbi:MAG: hypothetical protein ACTHMS_16250, partial [Jatrophihabitans sp.]
LADCHWEPVERERTLRLEGALRVVSRTEVPLRAARVAAEVGGSAVAGEPSDVLTDLSAVADLVVMGADVAGGVVARDVVAGSRCPVLVLPPQPQWEAHRDLPVTVLLPTPDIPQRLLQIAVDEAEREHVALRVLQLHGALRHPARQPSELIAEEQVGLGELLYPLREQHPDVAFVGEIDVDDPLAAVTRVADSSRMLAASTHSLRLVDGAEALARCPVLFVPETDSLGRLARADEEDEADLLRTVGEPT